jgi:toxin ParE1/3/4
MNIAWTRRAVRNLHHVRNFIRLDNPAASERVGARIEAAAANLARFPESGRIGEVPGTRELVLPALPYLIVYRVSGDSVQILRVLHEKQKWPQST